jgi:hypothetical protein
MAMPLEKIHPKLIDGDDLSLNNLVNPFLNSSGQVSRLF